MLSNQDDLSNFPNTNIQEQLKASEGHIPTLQ